MVFPKFSPPSDRIPESSTLDLVLAQDGDALAFRRFVIATEVDVRRFCAWLCRPGSDLDDLVQETYVRAFRGLASFRSESSGRSWLLTIARRVCADHVKRLARDRRNLSAVAEISEPVNCNSDFVDAVSEVNNLSPIHREAFVLVSVLGFTYQEAADILGCPRGTVQSRVARARQELIERTTESARTATPRSTPFSTA